MPKHASCREIFHLLPKRQMICGLFTSRYVFRSFYTSDCDPFLLKISRDVFSGEKKKGYQRREVRAHCRWAVSEMLVSEIRITEELCGRDLNTGPIFFYNLGLFCMPRHQHHRSTKIPFDKDRKQLVSLSGKLPN